MPSVSVARAVRPVDLARSRQRHPLAAHDAPSAPDSTVQIQLTEFEEVPWTHVHAAGRIHLAARHEIHRVVGDLQWTRNVAIKLRRQPGMRGHSDCATDQIHTAGAVRIHAAGCMNSGE